MGVSYDVFTGAFLAKVTEYEFGNMDAFNRTHMVDSYMKAACAQFNKVCAYDLSSYDDIIREFDVDIPDADLDEIADIVSDGMVVQWLKPYTYRQENLENVLSTRDFSTYSPAELLNRVCSVYNGAKSDFTSMMRGYSYDHGDLSDLHL